MTPIERDKERIKISKKSVIIRVIRVSISKKLHFIKKALFLTLEQG